MDAVVMVGDSGDFFDMGEKGCIDLLGKLLITYVIDALEEAREIDDIFVAVSSDTVDAVKAQYGGRVRQFAHLVGTTWEI